MKLTPLYAPSYRRQPRLLQQAHHAALDSTFVCGRCSGICRLRFASLAAAAGTLGSQDAE